MSVKKLRQQAATCFEMASTMRDPNDRARLLKTAQTFQQLADDEEGAGDTSLPEQESTNLIYR